MGDEKFSDAQLTRALLTNIQSHLKGIRTVVKFFVVLTAIELIVGLLYILAHRM